MKKKFKYIVQKMFISQIVFGLTCYRRGSYYFKKLIYLTQYDHNS